MKKFLFLLLIATLLLAACAPKAADTADVPAEEADAPAAEVVEEEAPAAVDVIKVGALYPLTGPDAGWAGDPYIKSHQMAKRRRWYRMSWWCKT